jgi:hypothetical protein
VKQNGIPSNTASGKPDPTFSAPDNDYDMRGFYKSLMAGDPNAKRSKNLHFIDTYKTPYHHLFSNESKYARPDAPHWVGTKLIDKNGKVIIDEGQ